MTFLEDALSLLGLKQELTPYPYRITVFGKSGAVIEGIKSIELYSEERIEISVRGTTLTIVGDKLKIKNYDQSEVVIVGKITGVCTA
ncbi:MAG: YabP/YqfC family sporulation protein [Clostridia bacterium]|nr:YabP/YqfC family sporulation protein [Clostridia bacterium]